MKTLLKQSKLSEKLILNEDEDILLDDEENIGESNISKEDKVINNILFRYEEEDKNDENVRNEMILDIIEELYPDLEAYSNDWNNVYRIYEEKLNCILDGKCESLKEDIEEDALLELEEPEDEIEYNDTEYFVVEVPNMSDADIKLYTKTYGLKSKKKDNSVLIYGDEETIEEMLKDYLGKWDKIGPIMTNGYYSDLEESLKEAEDPRVTELKRIIKKLEGINLTDAQRDSLEEQKDILMDKLNKEGIDYNLEESLKEYLNTDGTLDDNQGFPYHNYRIERNDKKYEVYDYDGFLKTTQCSLEDAKHYIDEYLNFDESLKEEQEDIEIPEVELEQSTQEEIPQEVADNAYLTQLNDLITSEYGKIDEVKSLIATFDSEDAIENNSEVISILNEFIDETIISIGILTKASELIDSTTSDLMKQGIEKAEDAIKNVDKEEDVVEESLKEEDSKKRELPKGKMITNGKGISYYRQGNKYYSNTGWLEKEISKEEFDKEVEKAFKELDEDLKESWNIAFECNDFMITDEGNNSYSLWLTKREKGTGKSYSPTTMYFKTIEDAKKYAIEHYGKDLDEE